MVVTLSFIPVIKASFFNVTVYVYTVLCRLQVCISHDVPRHGVTFFLCQYLYYLYILTMRMPEFFLTEWYVFVVSTAYQYEVLKYCS